MITTASIEKLLGPSQLQLSREIGKCIDHREILKVVNVGETVRIRQLHMRIALSENFMAECLKRLTKEGFLSMSRGRFAGNDCHFYTRLK